MFKLATFYISGYSYGHILASRLYMYSLEHGLYFYSQRMTALKFPIICQLVQIWANLPVSTQTRQTRVSLKWNVLPFVMEYFSTHIWIILIAGKYWIFRHKQHFCVLMVQAEYACHQTTFTVFPYSHQQKSTILSHLLHHKTHFSFCNLLYENMPTPHPLTCQYDLHGNLDSHIRLTDTGGY